MICKSDYWNSLELDTVYWQFNWSEEGLKRFISNQKRILLKYVEIAHKYQVLLPSSEFFFEDQIWNSEVFSEASNAQIFLFHLLYDLSYLKKDGVESVGKLCPTKMFIDNENGEIQSQILVDVNGNQTIFSKVPNGIGPITVSTNYFNEVYSIYFTIESDCFFPELIDWNKKIRKLGLEKIDSSIIDNSDLFYLNTPRLNSFLRDVNSLFLNEGASFFYENLIDEDIRNPYFFNEKGVLNNKEIIYYEDIKELLEPKFRVF